MLTERGVVISVEGNRAKVQVTRSAMCAHCESQGTCNALGSSPKAVVSAVNQVGAGQGDLVEVSMKESRVLKAAALVYLVPVAGLVLGAMVGDSLAASMHISADAGAGLGSLLGIAAGLAVTAVAGRKASQSGDALPVISRVVVRHMGPSMELLGSIGTGK